jgi:8-oxo-dGTP pyrophosphatase MutT (NUDIX family)
MSDPEFIIPFDRLPDGFVESVKVPRPRPSIPRPAATIVLMRDAPEGLEVLLMRRNRTAGFVPGAYVFPGGRVDTSDASPDIVARLDGLTSDDASVRLGLREGRPAAIAYYLAAVREAFEETGILLGRTPEGAPPTTAADDPAIDAVRDLVMEDRLAFASALDRLGCRIDGSALEYLAHWITPEVEPRRYDTRFFAARVPPATTAIVDPREMTDAVWLAPSLALRRNRQASLPMVFPTLKTLEQLAAYRNVDAALDDLAGREIPTFLPRLVVTPTGVGLRLD